MGNDRHENYDEDESEYQFSDDQINYDVDSETKATEPAPPVSKLNFLNQLTPYRRIIIGVLVFVVILFIVYKMLTPISTTTPPPSEFSPNSAANPIPQTLPSTQQPVVPAGKLPVPAPSVAPSTPVATPPVSMPSTMPSPQPQQSVSSQAMPLPLAPGPVMPAAAPPMAAPAPSPMPQMNMMPAPTPMPVQAPAPASISAPASETSLGPANAPPQTMSLQTPPASLAPQQVFAVESQNSAMMNAQFAAKIAEYDTQNKMLQEKVQTLNKRMANMEATLNKMAELVRDGSVKRIKVPAAPRAPEPKMIYAVQAIIPGRAWLKSESGDTVTVAEGDILKDYGRIVKIDPYDGIVQIDNGNRIISLSYGSNGD